MNTLIRYLRTRNTAYFLSAAFGLAVFLCAFGYRIIFSDWTGWLGESGRVQYQSAWLAYRNAAWSFPLGKLPLFFYPHGSSIAFMDGAPWYLTFLKLLSPVLPQGFPVWGFWIATCLILQGITARLLMEQLSQTEVSRWLGVLILTFSPVLIERHEHIVLMAQWTLLLGWYLFFKQEENSKIRWQWFLLLIFVAGIHPYLTAMIFTLRVTSLLISKQSWSERCYDIVLGTSGILLTFLIFGYFSNGSTKEPGAEYFTADIAAFFLSMDTSTLWPSLPFHFGEHEGFAYLGAAGIAIALAALISITTFQNFYNSTTEGTNDGNLLRKARYAIGIGVLLFIFAMGPHLRFLGEDLAENSKSNPLFRYILIGVFKKLPLIFRAPGRFLWPLYYLLLALGARVVTSRRLILITLLLLQFVDLGPFLLDPHQRIRSALTPPELQNSMIEMWIKNAKKIRFIPIEPHTACEVATNNDSARILRAILPRVARLQIPINSGLQARTPVKKLFGFCEDELKDYKLGKLDPDALYIIDNAFLDSRYEGENSAMLCRKFETTSFCLVKRAN